jgi:hypothetical protein
VLSHHKDFAKLNEKKIIAPKAVKIKAVKIMDVTDKIKALKTRACFLLNQ